MFDIGFIELLLCAVIALLVLGPERLPVAARATGRWIGKARRMARTFTSELDRQLKADELREKIRKEGSELGAEEIQRNFKEGLDQAKKYKDFVINDDQVTAAPTRGPASPANAGPATTTPPLETEPELAPASPGHDSPSQAEEAPVAPKLSKDQKSQEAPHQ